MNDNYPSSPSYSSNPFEKYKTARNAALPPGIVGIGTGSTSRFQPRRKGNDRKKIVRGLAIAVAVGLIWFIWGSSLSGIANHGGARVSSDDNTYSKVKESTSGQNQPSVPISAGKTQPVLEKATLVMLIRLVNFFSRRPF